MILILFCLGFWLYLVQSTSGLPLRVAVHFAASGRATGWISRGDHLLLMVALGMGLPVVLAVMGAVVCFLSCLRTNRTSPETEPSAVERLPANFCIFRYLIWLACWVVGFAAGVQNLIVQANSSLPASLPIASLLALVVSFCAVVVVWFSKLLATLRRRREPSSAP